MHQPQSRYHCHFWLPDLFNNTGGIQRYSSFCLNAFQTLYPNFTYDILIKHDTVVPTKSPNLCFHPTGNWPLFLRTPAFATQIISLSFWQRPNLILSTHLNFSVTAYLLKQLIGIPYWVVAHGIEAWNIQKSTLQIALKHADRILAVSHYTRDRLLQEQDLDPDKVVVLPNTFDADNFRIAPKPTILLKRYGLNPKQPVILTVARLSTREQYKGYDKILTALPQIRQAIPDIHYVLVGEGDDRLRVEQLISQFQLQDCVTLTGYIGDKELGDHYNLCDVFAMPSKGEGFGIVYLEALACGKPTLGGNKDGALDALCQGELGALVDPDDTEAIAQTLIQIVQGIYPNPLLYQPEQLRSKVIDQFGFDRFQHTLSGYLENYFQSS
ncbi:glycosyltransferase [Cylindrospermum sp. FACHB-282]|uniref:glycosyltransferase n=1 Tax=Cylindrospermum sp. FACHB-282 TaxID=2692794 RepID=UPI0016863C0C|nr:glycosyltransferase [Cylindrospermum sp. FACHB-282]MBD2385320.1 glycosyltransferase [Cylindrospermum sp. FACHB-282]